MEINSVNDSYKNESYYEYIKNTLSKYGHLSDDTEYLTSDWKNKIDKSYMLFFNDSISSSESEDISIDIHLCNEGYFIIEKGSLALTTFATEQVLFIENKLKETPFQMGISSFKGYTAVNFIAEAKSTNEMLEMVEKAKNILRDFVLKYGNFNSRKV